ncbi:MAG: radical SAM family heme chaperone HemW [Anaerolineaceae bacterium]
MKEAGIYIHIPFCKSRCQYCDFNTSAGLEAFIPDYCLNLVKEIKVNSLIFQKEYSIGSIYLGGGTPSYLPANYIQTVIQTIQDTFSVSSETEISMEANPADITLEKSKIWRAAGINRLSIGMQSAQDDELKMLGRRHCFKDVLQAVDIIHNAGITNFNLDLMFGLPHQSMQTWQDSVTKALQLAPSHLSLYALTVEERTPLAADIQAGILPAPDDDLAADMYEWVMDFLDEHGFEQYEISNWAKQDDAVDYRCQHNLLYWRNQDYFGSGAAAHSHVSDQRWANGTCVPEYIQTLISFSEKENFPFPWFETYTKLTPADDMGETAMMGLRLVEEGLRDDLFQEKVGKSLFDVYKKQIDDLVHLELLEVVEGEVRAIRLTKRGRLVGNQVFLRFLID